MTEQNSKYSLRIESYTHGIRVCNYNYAVLQALLSFSKRFGEYGLVRKGPGRFEKELIRLYACSTANRREMRFLITQKQELIDHLAAHGITKNSIEFVDIDVPTPKKVEFETIHGLTPRDYQVPLIDYLIDPNGPHSRLITLYTGGGKSLVGLEGIKARGNMAAMVIKPMYFKKWIKDIERGYKLKKSDLVTIQGTEQLVTAIELAKLGELDAKFLVISITTLQNYIKAYENDQDSEFLGGIRPEELWGTLGVGTLAIDEAHLLFHFIFKMFCYTNIDLSFALSATIISDKPIVQRMYEYVWPKRLRAPEVQQEKFIAVQNYWYSMNSMRGIRVKNAMNQYSQNYFEESIFKDDLRKLNFFTMIASVAKQKFVDVREEGQKAIVFCGLVDTCTAVTEFLKEQFPDLRVERYVSGDPFDEKNAADITVTTVLSGGTAIDIPNLRTSMMFVALDSVQSNVQVLGRTRKLKDWPDVTPEFIFFSCREIEAHNRYAQSKRPKFDGKVLSFKEVETSFRL